MGDCTEQPARCKSKKKLRATLVVDVVSGGCCYLHRVAVFVGLSKLSMSNDKDLPEQHQSLLDCPGNEGHFQYRESQLE